MKRSAKYIWVLVTLLLLFLAACGGAQPTSAPVDPNAFYTQAAQTVMVQLTETALSVPPVATATPTLQATPTLLTANTPLASDTPSETNTPFTINPPAATPETCDNFLYIDDITIPDGSIVGPEEVFEKTWEIQNTGPCTWLTNYKLIYGWASEDWAPMINNTSPSYLTQEVKPGEFLDISVTLTAPKWSGEYSAAFRMQNGEGYNFGIPLIVFIKVEGTPRP